MSVAWEKNLASDVGDIGRLGRRIGFGFGPEEELPSDLLSWAFAQLDAPANAMGYASFDSKSEPATWPSHLIWTLQDRVAHLLDYKVERDEADRIGDPNERARIQRELNLQHVPKRYDAARWMHQAIVGDAPVLERFVHFWANHFTVDTHESHGSLVGSFVEEPIRAGMNGNFADLLYASTTHPAMLEYLDAPYSIGPKSRLGKEFKAQGKYADLNENLARELLELHSVSPAAGYSQQDIIEAARILTGWGYTPEVERNFPGTDRRAPFFKDKHEPGSKVVLGLEIAEGEEGLRTLTDFLAEREETRHFVATKLVRHFVSDEAKADDVAAVVRAWETAKGSLPAIHRAVIERAVASEQRKFLWPATWLLQMQRISGARLIWGFDDIDKPRDDFNLRGPEEILAELGQTPWTVRQPNGFSDLMSDWVSPEHMDRRVRFSVLTAEAGRPAMDALSLVERLALPAETAELVAKGKTPTDQFVLLFCSQSMMEA